MTTCQCHEEHCYCHYRVQTLTIKCLSVTYDRIDTWHKWFKRVHVCRWQRACSAAWCRVKTNTAVLRGTWRRNWRTSRRLRQPSRGSCRPRTLILRNCDTPSNRCDWPSFYCDVSKLAHWQLGSPYDCPTLWQFHINSRKVKYRILVLLICCYSGQFQAVRMGP